MQNGETRMTKGIRVAMVELGGNVRHLAGLNLGAKCRAGGQLGEAGQLTRPALARPNSIPAINPNKSIS